MLEHTFWVSHPSIPISDVLFPDFLEEFQRCVGHDSPTSWLGFRHSRWISALWSPAVVELFNYFSNLSPNVKQVFTWPPPEGLCAFLVCSAAEVNFCSLESVWPLTVCGWRPIRPLSSLWFSDFVYPLKDVATFSPSLNCKKTDGIERTGIISKIRINWYGTNVIQHWFSPFFLLSCLCL